MIYDLVTFGGFIFWGFFAFVVFIIMCLREAREPFGGGFWVAVVFAAIVAAISPIPEFTWATVGICVVAYLIAGICWSTGRWYYFLRAVRSLVLNHSEDSENTVQWELEHQIIPSVGYYPPTVHRYSSNIWYWLVFWPVDALYTSLHGPWTWVHENLIQVFSVMQRKMLSGVELPKK